MERVQLGPGDGVAPYPVDRYQVSSLYTGGCLYLHWAASADDSNGAGVVSYPMERNGQFAGAPMTPALTDCTVTPGQTYTYRFYVLDRHVNWAPATDVTVTAGGGAGLPPGILAPDAVRLGRDLRAHLFAWKLLAGALTPIWSGYELSYFLFTDSTGAEYRLDVNEGGVWRSRQGVYVFYDANTARLNSPDGSHWHMSAG